MDRHVASINASGLASRLWGRLAVATGGDSVVQEAAGLFRISQAKAFPIRNSRRATRLSEDKHATGN